MPSENLIIEPVLDASTDATAHNAEVARKLAEQDAAGRTTAAAPEDIADSSSALDKLAEAQAKEKENPPEDVTPEVTPEVTTPTPEEKAKADEAAAKAAADLKADQERAEAFFKDAPKLPPNASPKSSEAFNSIKIRAAKDISERDAEIEKLRKEIAERDEKLKNPLPPETEKEIKELREWRAKLDVDADPKFKEFDKGIEQTREFIYSQLSQNPNVNPALIETIKKHGGPEMIKWDKIFDGLKDPTLQRMIESKIADIEMAKFNKAQAVKASKENIQQYLGERQKQFETARTEHTKATQQHLTNYIDKSLTWMREKPLDPKADAATKKAVEDHNAFINQLKGELMGALNDDTPEIRAMMIAGMAQLVYVQKLHDADKKAWEADKKALAEATATLAKIKGASSSRLRENAAPTDRVAPAKTDDKDLFTKPATQALDDLMKDMMEKRAKASATA